MEKQEVFYFPQLALYTTPASPARCPSQMALPYAVHPVRSADEVPASIKLLLSVECDVMSGHSVVCHTQQASCCFGLE